MSPRFLFPLCLSLACLSFFFTRQLAPAASKSAQAAAASSQTPLLKSTQELLSEPRPISAAPSEIERVQPALSLQQILGTIREKDLAPADARLEYIETIVKLRPDALEALVYDMTKNAEWWLQNNVSRFCFDFVVSRLAEVAPEKAANIWLSQDRFHGEADLFLGPWAQKDPQNFASWCLSLSPEVQLASARALGSIAFGAPDQFASIAPLLMNSPAAAKAAGEAMDFFIRQSSSDTSETLAKAIEYAKTLPEGPMRIAALSRLPQTLPFSDAITRPEVLAAVAALPPEEAFRLGINLSKKSAVLPAGVAREGAFYYDFFQQAGRDSLAAAARLESVVSPQDYPAAVRGFVGAIANKDPWAAADWALSIPPENSTQRAAALDQVAKALVRKDPAAAKAWVESAPLSPEEYFVLSGRQRVR
jgi:hypothetical protein